MALTYTWKVTGLKVRDEVNADGETLANAVVQTYWKLTGTDEHGHEGSFAGATPFSAANVSADSFIDFATLAEDDVIAWIQKVVDADATYKAHIDERIMGQINEQHTIDANLPWKTEEDAPEAADPENPAA